MAIFQMKRLGKNHGGYHGETIDIARVLNDIAGAARANGWSSETFHTQGGFDWLALHRKSAAPRTARRIYISAGIHGDEPAGPLAAVRLLEVNHWPVDAEIFLLPCLNPTGFTRNSRENIDGIDLNRDYLEPKSPGTIAHIAWLKRQPSFDLCLCLHEDWESHGFYLYELNPDNRPSQAEAIIEAVARVCPVDESPVIEGREANGGIIRPSLDPNTRPLWPEAFWLIQNKTRHSHTFEAPSDFELRVRVDSLCASVNAALQDHAR